MNTDQPIVTLHCGPKDRCRCECGMSDSKTKPICEHKWDGESIGDESFQSVTCSRCGMSCMSHDMRYGL